MSAEKVYSIEERRAMLEDATRRLNAAKADKKRDDTVHKENINAITAEINDILRAIDESR